MGKINELKKVGIKSCTCFYPDDIIKILIFYLIHLNLYNILLDEYYDDFHILYENILMFLTKLWLVQIVCILCSIKQMGLSEVMMKLNL